MEFIPADIKYADDFYELWSNFEVIKYTNRKQFTDKNECTKFLKGWLERVMDKDIPNHFVIKDCNNIVGICGYPIISKNKFQCGIYYQIKQKYWGKGYGTKAMNKMIDEIINNYRHGTIIADVVTSNVASIKILKKFKFRETSVEKSAFKMYGLEDDIINLKRKI